MSALRDFLRELEAKGDAITVHDRVSLEFEISALSRAMLDLRGPALIFDNVQGFADFPVCTNVFATRGRFAAALGCAVPDIHRVWLERSTALLEPIPSRDTACQEVEYRGADVDLGRLLPIARWNEHDGGPYISMGVAFTEGGSSGDGRNAAIYRIQVHGPRRLGIQYPPFRHIALHRKSVHPKPLPVAIVIGAAPAVYLAACAPAPYGTDEMKIAGALSRAPVEMIPCRTIPLSVPASSEIVIEGYFHPDDDQLEGPYGEFTGFYGNAKERPVITVECITMRRNPILLCAYQGRPPQDSTILQSVPAECEILRLVSLPGVRQVHFTEEGCGTFHAVVSVDKRFEGYGKMVGMAILGTWGGRYIKKLTVVSSDIDATDAAMVEWATSTRVQPARDIAIIDGVVGINLDPSMAASERAAETFRTSKMIVDATGYGEGVAVADICSPPSHLMASATTRARELLTEHRSPVSTPPA